MGTGIIERFGTTDLTLYNGSDDIPVAPLLGKHQGLLAGGAVGGWGDQRRRSGLRTITKSGELIADSTTELQTSTDILRALAGTRDQLFIRMADGTVRWLYADLDDADMPRAAENTLFLPVDLSWTPLDPYWRTGHHGGGWVLGFDHVLLDTGYVLGEDEDALFDIDPSPTLNYNIVHNNGNVPATLVKITIHAGDADITTDVGAGYAVRLISTTASGGVPAGGAFDVQWAGTLGAGHDLEIDGSILQVLAEHVDAYSGLSLDDTGHNVDGWFSLDPGSTRIQTIIFGGGSGATMTVDYFDAFS